MSDSPAPGMPGDSSWLRSPVFWAVSLAALICAWIYQPLFFPESHQSLSSQSEEFFFEPNEAAGAPVLVLSAWLFYRRTHLLDVLRGPGAALPAGVLLGIAVGLFGWGQFTSAPDLQLASIVPLLFGAAFAFGGMAGARAYCVPILFLIFSLPVPPVLLSTVIFPIQLMTAENAGMILNLIGVKSLVAGDQILRPTNTFVVIETCSGVRTVLTIFMLTVLLVDLFERRGRHAFLLFLFAPFVAFVSNGIRVVTLVLNPHSQVHSIHNLQGIVMLLVGLVGMYVLDLGLERVLGSRDPASDDGDYGERSDGRVSVDATWAITRCAAVLLSLASMVALGRFVVPFQPPSGIDEMPDAVLTRLLGEERSRAVSQDLQFRGSVRYLAYANRALERDGAAMEVFLGVANEKLRKFTMLSERLAWPSSGLAPIDESWIELADEHGAPLDVRRLVFRRGARQIVSYSAFMRDRSRSVEFLRQLFALDRSPLARDEHMLAFRISTTLRRQGDDLARADRRLSELWGELVSRLDGYAPYDPARREPAAP